MQIAVIREEDCVGCAKCLSACPVDAIVGASKFLHTVLAQECIGCELCIAPCPMDCIEIKILPNKESDEERKAKALQAKNRYQASQQRKILEKPLQLTYVNDPEFKSKVKEEMQKAYLRVQQKRLLNNDANLEAIV
jgi:Na+-translocating ferredoxin:NAD+ oxidoreductase subunit B